MRGLSRFPLTSLPPYCLRAEWRSQRRALKSARAALMWEGGGGLFECIAKSRATHTQHDDSYTYVRIPVLLHALPSRHAYTWLQYGLILGRR